MTHESQCCPEFVVFTCILENDTKWGMKCKSRYTILQQHILACIMPIWVLI